MLAHKETGCTKQPCLNNGTCEHLNETNKISCSCRSEYTGKYCESIVSPCNSNPCKLNQYCIISNSNLGYSCECDGILL